MVASSMHGVAILDRVRLSDFFTRISHVIATMKLLAPGEAAADSGVARTAEMCARVVAARARADVPSAIARGTTLEAPSHGALSDQEHADAEAHHAQTQGADR